MILGLPQITFSGSHAINAISILSCEKIVILSLKRAVISVANGNQALISMPGFGEIVLLLKSASGKPGSCLIHSPMLHQSCLFNKSTVENSIIFPRRGESFEITLASCFA